MLDGHWPLRDGGDSVLSCWVSPRCPGSAPVPIAWAMGGAGSSPGTTGVHTNGDWRALGCAVHIVGMLARREAEPWTLSAFSLQLTGHPALTNCSCCLPEGLCCEAAQCAPIYAVTTGLFCCVHAYPCVHVEGRGRPQVSPDSAVHRLQMTETWGL